MEGCPVPTFRLICPRRSQRSVHRQAYLDLVELLGNAALDGKGRRAWRCRDGSISASTGSRTDSASPAADEGLEQEDAGDVLLSILTCHSITQITLFQRLIRGAIRFQGIGSPCRTHYLSGCASSVSDNRPSIRTTGHSQSAVNPTSPLGSKTIPNSSPTKGSRGMKKVGVLDRMGTQGNVMSKPSMALSSPASQQPLERCSRLLAHCVRWIRQRHGETRTARNRSCSSRADLFLSEYGDPSSEDDDGQLQDSVGAMADGREKRDGSSRRHIARANPAYQDGDGDLDDHGDAHDGDPVFTGSSNSGNAGSVSSQYDTSPESVMLPTPRECYAALSRVISEFESALVCAVASRYGHGGVEEGGGGHGLGEDIAENLSGIFVSVSCSLRRMLVPSTSQGGPAPTVPSASSGKQDGTRSGSPIAEIPASTVDVPDHCTNTAGGSTHATTFKRAKGKHSKKHLHRAPMANLDTDKPDVPGCDLEGPSVVVVNLLPEAVKLRIVLLLERIYVAGRTAAFAASTALAKLPPQAMSRRPVKLTTLLRASCTDASSRVCSDPSNQHRVPSSPATASASPFKRRRARVAMDNGKPGDQAGGPVGQSSDFSPNAASRDNDMVESDKGVCLQVIPG